MEGQKWLRKVGLFVGGSVSRFAPRPVNPKALDLSQMHFRFRTAQSDVQTPNSCEIRVWNLSSETAEKVQNEYDRVVLYAGYQENSSYGIVFQGDIKQTRRGKENATDTYLDILAADGDFIYNFGVTSTNVQAGSTALQRARAASDSALESVRKFGGLMDAISIDSYIDQTGLLAGTLPRGKVMFGMWRDQIRDAAATLGGTWSIQDGRVQIISLEGYKPGEAVVLNPLTGMIGIPEQTEAGVQVRSLINARMKPGALVRMNAGEINQLIQKNPDLPIPFNQFTGWQFMAKVPPGDGTYRVFVAEHSGDTRGQEWYTDLTCLAFDKSSRTVAPYGSGFAIEMQQP